MYQLNGEQHLHNWFAGQTDAAARMAMLEWLPKLCADPWEASTMHRGPSPSVFVAAVPGTNAFVDYLVSDQYKTVLILAVIDGTLE
jgi:hypothetical protein